MRSFLGLIGFCLVVYGPRACINPRTRFGRWCLAASGDWVYREQRIAYDAGCKAYLAGKPRGAPSSYSVEQTYFWLSGWDDEISQASFRASKP